MTHFDRALTRAYARRQTAEGSAPEEPENRSRGWVSRLRNPVETPTDLESYVAVDEPEHAGFASQLRTPVHTSDTSAGENEELPSAPAGAQAVAAENVSTPHRTDWSFPEICERLIASTAGPGLRRLAASLHDFARAGGRCVAFTGNAPQVGRTTLAITIARLMAEQATLRLLLAEVDSGRPDLAAMLKLTPEFAGSTAADPAASACCCPLIPGWLSYARLPASEPAEQTTGTSAIALALAAWRNQFDLILLDPGTRHQLDAHPSLPARLVEGVVHVDRFDPALNVDGIQAGYRQQGLRLLGIVETFSPTAQSVSAATDRS